MKKILYLDIETDSPVDLKTYGVLPYSTHPDFRILCGVIYDESIDSNVVFKRDPKSNFFHIRDYVATKKDFKLVAHNASFEMTCLKLLEANWHCTAMLSRVLSGPSDLATCSKLWLKKDLKNVEGWKLTKACSGPDYLESDVFKQLVQYCKDDVKITVALFKRLSEILGINDFLEV